MSQATMETIAPQPIEEELCQRRVHFSSQDTVIWNDDDDDDDGDDKDDSMEVDDKNEAQNRADQRWYTRQELGEIRNNVRFRLLLRQHKRHVSLVAQDEDDHDDNDGLDGFADAQRCARQELAARTILRCDRKLRHLQAQLAGTNLEDVSQLLAKVATRIADTARRGAMERGLVQYCNAYPERVMERFPSVWHQYTQILQQWRQQQQRAPQQQQRNRALLQRQQARRRPTGRSVSRVRPQLATTKRVGSSSNSATPAATTRTMKRYIHHDDNVALVSPKRRCIRAATQQQHQQHS